MTVISATGERGSDAAAGVLTAIGENFGSGRVLVNGVEDVDLLAFGGEEVVLEGKSQWGGYLSVEG